MNILWFPAGEGASNNGWVDNGDFSVLLVTMSSEPLEIRPALLSYSEFANKDTFLFYLNDLANLKH